jgi:chromosome segregation ATPase
MAGKPKTYAEQVTDLKRELEQKNDALERLTNVDQELAHANQRIQDLESRQTEANKSTNSGVTALKAQLTDAQQQAEANAVAARQSEAARRQLEGTVAALKEQLSNSNTDTVTAQHQAQIELIRNELNVVRTKLTATIAQANTAVTDAKNEVTVLSGHLRNERFKNKEYEQHVIELQQRVKQATADADNRIAQMSNELRTLRLRDQANTRIIEEFRAAIEQAPDTIGHLRNLLGR